MKRRIDTAFIEELDRSRESRRERSLRRLQQRKEELRFLSAILERGN